MTPITVYKEDIENACRHLNESTVMGVRRAHNILVNMLTITEGRPEENNTEDQITNQQAILEILDIMMNSNCSRGWNRSTILETRLKALKNKLEGEK
jgi:hypothetical protein